MFPMNFTFAQFATVLPLHIQFGIKTTTCFWSNNPRSQPVSTRVVIFNQQAVPLNPSGRSTMLLKVTRWWVLLSFENMKIMQLFFMLFFFSLVRLFYIHSLHLMCIHLSMSEINRGKKNIRATIKIISHGGSFEVGGVVGEGVGNWMLLQVLIARAIDDVLAAAFIFRIFQRSVAAHYTCNYYRD